MRMLKPKEISCRVQQINEKGLTLLLYVTSRAGQTMLDEKYGPLGWQDEYSVIDGNLYCKISAWDESKKLWVAKQDVGTASFTEKEKGRASDAFKRACVKHGIARELYSAPFIWIPASACNIKNANGKCSTRDKFTVSEITYNASSEIDALTIVNQELDIVFKKYPSGKITQQQYVAITEMIQKAKVDVNEILEVLKISDLQDMDINSYRPICNKLQKTIEQKSKSNGA